MDSLPATRNWEDEARSSVLYTFPASTSLSEVERTFEHGSFDNAPDNFELRTLPAGPDWAERSHSPVHGDLDIESSDKNCYLRGDQPYSSEEEKLVVSKLDKHLVLFVALLYLLSFLDRSSTLEPSSV